MHQVVPTILLAGALALAGCMADSVKLDTSPAVSVSADRASGVGPLEVQFFSSVASGNGLLTYQWDFGDGQQSSDVNPSHLFAANSQAYDVVLTVTDEDGDDGAANLGVAVGTNNQPTVVASASPAEGDAPLTVNFSCEVGGGNGELKVEWSFGQGSSDRFASTTFTFVDEGIYIASCTAEDEDGDLARATVGIGVGFSLPDAGVDAGGDGEEDGGVLFNDDAAAPGLDDAGGTGTDLPDGGAAQAPPDGGLVGAPDPDASPPAN